MWLVWRICRSGSMPPIGVSDVLNWFDFGTRWQIIRWWFRFASRCSTCLWMSAPMPVETVALHGAAARGAGDRFEFGIELGDEILTSSAERKAGRRNVPGSAGCIQRKRATWKLYFQARLATRPTSRNSCTGISIGMILRLKASSGRMLVSDENRRRRWRAM